MFNEELKNEFKKIYDSNKKIDDEFVNIKIAIHNLEKLGLDTKNLEKMLDNVGIEFYKLKQNVNEKIRTKF